MRNYQASNFMRDGVEVGDGVLYYHSNTKPPGIAGVARVSKAAYPDPEQFNEDSKYYDPKATPETPRWVVVDVEFVARFDGVLSLDQLKADDKLDGMLVTRKGQRLSIQPVEVRHWRLLSRKNRIPYAPHFVTAGCRVPIGRLGGQAGPWRTAI